MSTTIDQRRVSGVKRRRSLSVGPRPRLRLYATLGQYAKVAAEVAAGRSHRGDEVSTLEATVAQRLGVQHALAMPMARTAIYFAVRALIKPGQKVILSPYTIVDVINMVVCAGGVPVFADIERETCNIDAAEVDRLIDADTGAVMVTHFYGLACDIERVARICRERGVPLIEDAAQAFGVTVNGRSVGTFGDIGVFSFGMFKNVNSFLGGMIVTDDGELRRRLDAELATLPIQPMRDYMRKVTQAVTTEIITHPALFSTFFFRLFRFGFLNNVDAINDRMKIDLHPELKREMPSSYLCRMSPLQARLVLEQLGRVEADMARRVQAARRYHEGLSDIEGLLVAPLRTDGSHMYWYYPIQFAKRHDLVAFALRQGRDITESYHRNCADVECFSPWHRDCPNARETAAELIYLPTYPAYSDREIDRTVSIIRSYFGR